jgi:putative MATE family efflux protein
VPVFIIQLMIFGFQSGMAVLVSQYWGRGDTASINRCLGVALYAVTAVSAVLALITCFFPTQVLGLITPNPDLVALGKGYIRIVGFSYVFNSISSIYAGVQRSTEHPSFGMMLFGISMAVNTSLNYVLIFGKFGAPALGVTGAAVATLTSRIVEFAVAVGYALWCKRLPLQWGCLLRPGRAILRNFIRYSTPVVCNETLWSLGTSMLTVIMGHMASSQDMLAAYALVGSIDRLATVVCFGLAASAAVIVGKEIGAGSTREHVYSAPCCGPRAWWVRWSWRYCSCCCRCSSGRCCSPSSSSPAARLTRPPACACSTPWPCPPGLSTPPTSPASSGPGATRAWLSLLTWVPCGSRPSR